MVGMNDAEYFAEREIQERSRAERCSDPVIAAIHLDMANRYAARLGGAIAEPVQRRRLTIAYAAG